MHRIPVPALPLDRPEYWLHDPQSVAALEALGEDLVETLTVILEAPDGAAMGVRLRFHHEVNCWIAYPTKD